MAIPDFQAVMLPILIITADKQEHSISELIELVSKQFKLTEEEKASLLPSGTQYRFDNRIHWAITYLSKAGLVDRTGRGIIRISDIGIKALDEKPIKIDKEFLSKYEGYKEFRKRRNVSESESTESTENEETTQTPDEEIEADYQKLRSDLAQEILERVKKVEPRFFENLVVDLLVAMGYGGSRVDAGKTVGKTGDGGIDGIINEDKLGLDVVYIQAKRWDGHNVGSKDLREFVGALSSRKANKGVYITTASFTQDAKTFVKDVQQKIVIIDGEQLAQYMIDHGIGVTTIRKYEVKRIDNDYFEGSLS
jgi:restriction system protein